MPNCIPLLTNACDTSIIIVFNVDKTLVSTLLYHGNDTFLVVFELLFLFFKSKCATYNCDVKYEHSFTSIGVF